MDLVIADVGMPGIDGTMAIGAIKKVDPNLKFIIISGTPNADGTERTFENLQHRFLRKPFTPLDLIRTIHEVLHDDRNREV